MQRDDRGGLSTGDRPLSPGSVRSQQTLPGLQLALHAAAHEIAEPEDVLIGEGVEGIEPLLPPGDEAEGEEELQVFGDVCLGETRPLDEIGDGGVAPAQALEELQPGGLRQGLEALGHAGQQFGGELPSGHGCLGAGPAEVVDHITI